MVLYIITSLEFSVYVHMLGSTRKKMAFLSWERKGEALGN